MEIEFIYLNVLVGTVIPLLVGLVTKLTAPSGVKAAANALLSALLGALVPVLSDCAGAATCVLGGREFVLGIGVTWVTSVATYYGLLKPSGAAGAVQQSSAGFGIGKDAA